jgi:hypothetical protein
MSSRTEIVENELKVKIPSEYSAFLERYGIYDPPGIEVYGITENLLHYDGIPCVIGATKNRRKLYQLPHRFFVIHHTGIEDEVICLDTEDEKVYSISRVFGDHKIADSFSEWFERDIIAYVKEREKRHKKFGEKSEPIIDLDAMRSGRDDT